ncbi:MAG TPA: hypothetical protein VFO65_02820 [Acidimicrobiales bacterium]|nr:hypothetical protein [Acidimicrobiales bacterium]
MPISPLVARAGLVILEPDGQQVRQVIALQYNPDTVNRSLKARSGSAEGGELQRVSGTATQTITFDAELDATDQLAQPDEQGNRVEVENGLHPYLAALEGLLNPALDQVLENARIAAEGFLEVVPTPSPSLVLVWSRHRVVPVRLTELSIVEEAFDTRLNPIRAKVSFSFTTLGVNELGTAGRLGAIAIGQHRRLETLAGARGFGTLTDLGGGITL